MELRMNGMHNSYGFLGRTQTLANSQPNNVTPLFGEMLKRWRVQRGHSQISLGAEARISTRHLSFLETGRAKPSRQMVLILGEHLDMPLRERNRMLAAAGFAPNFAEHRLDDPGLSTVRSSMEMVLTAHEPFPALIVDKRMNLVSHNNAVMPLLAGVDPELLKPPVSVIRLTLHPEGLSSRILNLPEWSGHLLHALKRDADASGDPYLQDLLLEMRSYTKDVRPAVHTDPQSLAVPLRLKLDDRVLSFISTVTVFRSPLDVTLSELALETLLPLDESTAAALYQLANMTPAR
jgi:transcriptional regulator with XRE-family HTH domain